jgi:hypothetical protein
MNELTPNRLRLCASNNGRFSARVTRDGFLEQKAYKESHCPFVVGSCK